MLGVRVTQARVRTALESESITNLVVSNGYFFVLTSEHKMIRWRDNDDVQQFDLTDLFTSQPGSLWLFVDAEGKHSYITSSTGENLYWRLGSPKPALVNRWHGLVTHEVSTALRVSTRPRHRS